MGDTVAMIGQNSAAKGLQTGDGGYPESSQIVWCGIRKPLIVIAGVFLLFFFSQWINSLVVVMSTISGLIFGTFF